ncbi:hypothetical protein Vadar_003546 [Vaccinium darrowii]|uniref:Uncharacterized protein n=1 Tax=Vaccinium darrowii TaxID=229202 RepID=A0ACB7WXE6_9ERIC|nr:hypothetical protein Vadar_003546 [Vaccinium darrowii]
MNDSFAILFGFQYEKAAAVLRSHHPPIILAKVDCNEKKNKGLASEFKIRGFPTIMILRNGAYGRKTIQEYIGPRDADSIVAFLTKQSGPAFREIKFVAYD